MPEPRHLRNAPIREAIVDFRVKARRELTAADLRPAVELLADAFPVVEEQYAREASLYLSTPAAPPQAGLRELGLQGYTLKSSDGLNVAQLRVGGFTFNRLAPYTSWEELRPRAMGAWQIYARTALPEAVTRLGLRYVNYIELPPGVHNLDVFLTAGPRIPVGWPQHLSAFLTYVVLHEPASRLAAAVKQSLEARIGAPEPALVLDIDAYCQEQLEPDASGIQRILDDLRQLTNRIFFSSLTERCVRLFE